MSGNERSCVYCGGRPLTGEHVWPHWIAKLVRDEKAEHYRTFESDEGEQSIQYRGSRYPFTTEAKCVCKACNEGWMHELETTAEAELTAMIQGKAQTLHEWRQAIAATWALKTAMMIEHSDSEDTRTIPTRIYRPFREFLRPTTTTNIWIAHYTGEEPHHFGHGLLKASVTGPDGLVEPDDAEPYASVLSVGQLAFWVVGHLVQGADIHRPAAHVAGQVARIWPITPEAKWPPAESVDDDGLKGLVMSLAS